MITVVLKLVMVEQLGGEVDALPPAGDGHDVLRTVAVLVTVVPGSVTWKNVTLKERKKKKGEKPSAIPYPPLPMNEHDPRSDHWTVVRARKEPRVHQTHRDSVRG